MRALLFAFFLTFATSASAVTLQNLVDGKPIDLGPLTLNNFSFENTDLDLSNIQTIDPKLVDVTLSHFAPMNLEPGYALLAFDFNSKVFASPAFGESFRHFSSFEFDVTSQTNAILNVRASSRRSFLPGQSSTEYGSAVQGAALQVGTVLNGTRSSFSNSVTYQDSGVRRLGSLQSLSPPDTKARVGWRIAAQTTGLSPFSSVDLDGFLLRIDYGDLPPPPPPPPPPDASVVPLPASVLLLALGLASFGVVARRKRA